MLVSFFRVRRNLLLENLALRQRLAVLKRRRRRPCLSPFDKLFWVAVSRFWSGWKQALIVVTPETVFRWHRAGFRLYWKLTSRTIRSTKSRFAASTSVFGVLALESEPVDPRL